MARILCTLVTLLALSVAKAEVEFFFNTSPSDPPEAISRIIHAIPIASVGHGTIYIASACRDRRDDTNRIRQCTPEDKQQGLVISFDVDLQRNTGYYFAAVTRNEFFCGNLDRNRLPPVITRTIIDDMDAHFFHELPWLAGDQYLRAAVEALSRDTGMGYEQLAEIMASLETKGASDKDLDTVLKARGIRTTPEQFSAIKRTARYLQGNAISERGMSRRVVTWGARFYQGVWGLVYPTTLEEERALIEFVNTMDQQSADILQVNCVMPLDTMGEALLSAGGESTAPAPDSKPPRAIYVPYFVMERLVEKAFQTDVEEVNEFHDFIRRPGTYMRFYPQIQIPFDDDAPRAPNSNFHNAELVKFYDRYQSEYANYLDWLADKLVANGTPENADTIVALRDLRQRVFADEKAINAFVNEQEVSAAPQAGLALKVEAMRLQILLKYRKELAYIVGAEQLAAYDPE